MFLKPQNCFNRILRICENLFNVLDFYSLSKMIIFIFIFCSSFSLNNSQEKPTPINWDHYSTAVKNKALFESMKAQV